MPTVIGIRSVRARRWTAISPNPPEKAAWLIPCARAARTIGMCSLDARSWGSTRPPSPPSPNQKMKRGPVACRPGPRSRFAPHDLAAVGFPKQLKNPCRFELRLCCFSERLGLAFPKDQREIVLVDDCNRNCSRYSIITSYSAQLDAIIWTPKPGKYKHRYSIEVNVPQNSRAATRKIEFYAPSLAGKQLSADDIGGLRGFFGFLQYCQEVVARHPDGDKVYVLPRSLTPSNFASIRRRTSDLRVRFPSSHKGAVRSSLQQMRP